MAWVVQNMGVVPVHRGLVGVVHRVQVGVLAGMRVLLAVLGNCLVELQTNNYRGLKLYINICKWFTSYLWIV